MIAYVRGSGFSRHVPADVLRDRRKGAGAWNR